MIAFRQCGIKPERYVAYEIDKYAIKVSQHNFPEIEHRGDVFEADFKEFEGFDFLIGGSPCTYWSIAKGKGRETEAHGEGWKLFQQFIRAVKEAKPTVFIYENNKSMSKAIKDEISNTFGFEPICINSALVSAQKRERYYWLGVRNRHGEYVQGFMTQPGDKGICLRDILESGEDLTSNEKSYVLTATYNGAVPWNTIERKQRSMVAEPIRVGLFPLGAKTGLYAVPMRVKEATKKGYVDVEAGTCVDLTQPNFKTRRGRLMEEKSNCLTTSHGMYQYLGATNERIYEVKNGQIEIRGKFYPIKLVDGQYIIRKLTVGECKKLQTVPDWYDMSVLSDNQSYKCLGNGWTVDVIVHLITHLKANYL